MHRYIIFLFFFSAGILLGAQELKIEERGIRTNVRGTYFTAELEYRTNIVSTVTVVNNDLNWEKVSTNNTDHTIFVIGMSPNKPTSLTVEFKAGRERVLRSVSIPRVVLPPYVPSIQVLKPAGPKEPNDLFLATQFKYSFIMDQEGSILWVSDKMLLIPRRLANGNFLAISNRDAIGTSSPYLHEIDLAGNIYQTYFLKPGIHHDAIPLDQDSLLVLGKSGTGAFKERNSANDALTEQAKRVLGVDFSLVDIIVQISKQNRIEAIWSMEKFLDPQRPSYSLGGYEDDWFHANALAYNSKKDTITISGRSQSAVVGFSRGGDANGTIKWILGSKEEPAPWPSRLESKILEIDEKDLFSTSHSTTWLKNGNLLLYDNGLKHDPQPYSRAVEYSINEKSMKAKLVRQFDFGKKYFTPITGDVHALDKNTWFVFFAFFTPESGLPTRMVKVKPSNQEILWEAIILPREGKVDNYFRMFPLTREWLMEGSNGSSKN